MRELKDLLSRNRRPLFIAGLTGFLLAILLIPLLWYSCFAITNFDKKYVFYDGDTHVCTKATEAEDCNLDNCYHCDEESGQCVPDESRGAVDIDKDNFYTCEGGGLDCDDSKSDVNPSATESCNMIDDNCNGIIDEEMLEAKGQLVEISSGKNPQIDYDGSQIDVVWEVEEETNKRVKFAYLDTSGSIQSAKYLTDGNKNTFNMVEPSLAFYKNSQFGIAWIDCLGGRSGKFLFINPQNLPGPDGNIITFTEQSSTSQPYNPQVATFNDISYIAVVWEEKQKDNLSSSDIYLGFFDQNGSFISERGRKNLSNTPEEESIEPSIVRAGSGFVIAWVEKSGETYEIKIGYISTGTGDFINQPMLLSNIPGFNKSNPSLGHDLNFGGSKSVVLFYDAQPQPNETRETYAVIIDLEKFENNENFANNPIRVTNAFGASEKPAVVWRGNVIGVAWIDQRNGKKEIFFRRFSKDLKIASDEINLGEGQDPSIVSFESDDKFAVVWWHLDNENSTKKIYFRSVGCK